MFFNNNLKYFRNNYLIRNVCAVNRRHTINGRPVDVKKAMSKDSAPGKGGGRGGGRGGDSGGWNNRGAPMQSQNSWGNYLNKYLNE